MRKSIFNSFYLSIFIFFIRKILRKVSPSESGSVKGRYVVIVTTEPVQAIVGSFRCPEDAFDMLNKLDDSGWGDDNLVYDAVNMVPLNEGYDAGWRFREAISVYSNRMVETEISDYSIEELRRFADDYGQSVSSTTFPGITGH